MVAERGVAMSKPFRPPHGGWSSIDDRCSFRNVLLHLRMSYSITMNTRVHKRTHTGQTFQTHHYITTLLNPTPHEVSQITWKYPRLPRPPNHCTNHITTPTRLACPPDHHTHQITTSIKSPHSPNNTGWNRACCQWDS